MTDEQEHEAEMDEGVRQLEATSLRLIKAVEDMSTRLNTTERFQRELERQQRELRDTRADAETQKKISWALTVSVVLDIILSVAVGWGYFRIDHNANNIAEIQDRTSREVLCPLYEVFLGSIETTDVETMTPEELERFEQAAATIQHGYEALDCVGAAPVE